MAWFYAPCRSLTQRYLLAAPSQRGYPRDVHSNVSQIPGAFCGRDDSLYFLCYAVKRLSATSPTHETSVFHNKLNARLSSGCLLARPGGTGAETVVLAGARDTGGICCEIGPYDVLNGFRTIHVEWS